MIDTHCHLEQPDYNRDRDHLIKRCRKQLRAVITCCAQPQDFDLTMKLANQYRGFIFATASIHPKYVREICGEEVRKYIALIRQNKENVVAIGETGLDYNWIKDEVGREHQKHLFVELITLAEDLQRPVVIHSRNATKEVIDILEDHKVKLVQMHMFSKRSLLNRVIDNGWVISVNTLLLTSKDVKKIVRDCPLTQIMLETDAPWLGINEKGKIVPKYQVRNEPFAVKRVAEKIATIKKIRREEVDFQTTNNAVDFFKLCS